MGEIMEGMKFIGTLISKKIFIYVFLIIGFLGALFVLYKMLYASENKGELLKRI